MKEKKLHDIALISKYLAITLIIFACSRKTQLQEGQKLLYLQTVIGNKSIPDEDLKPYFKQRANTKVLGVPVSLYAYNFGLLFYDTARTNQIANAEINSIENKINKSKSEKNKKKWTKLKERKLNKIIIYNQKGNWWMRNMGEQPVVFDSLAAKQTQTQLKLYLKSVGFFYSNVSYKLDTIANSILVRYIIVENKRSYITKFAYSIQDGYIKRLINDNIDESLVKIGDPYNEQILSNERDRIESLLKNNGYYDFTKRYVSFQIDTVFEEVSVNCVIDNPNETSNHRLYKIKKINFRIDNENIKIEPLKIINQDSVNFEYYSDRRYSPKVILTKMEFNNYKPYSLIQSKYTQRNLTQLDVFKFVNISYKKDTLTNTLEANITANSSSKYQISDEIGFSVSQGLPGPFGSIGFTNRNIFNHCEIFNINVRAGIEGVASASDPGNIYSSQQFGLNASLSFPRLVGLMGLNKLFIDYNPKTSLNSSYNFIFRPEYTRSSLQSSYTYSLTFGKYSILNFNPIDIVYLRTPYISNDFSKYLDVLLQDYGNSLKTSFRNSINPNINASYTYNSFLLGENKNATFFRIFAESGGTTQNLLSKNAQFELFKKLEVTNSFQYVKFNIDVRKYIPITKKSTFAARINLGVARPYGGQDERNMPYEKYFFSGGSNSVRAWLPRRLGPGSYRDTVYLDRLYRYEQPGLLVLELSAEYRFKIIKFLDGAIFTDGGNVWWFNDSDERKNIKISSFNEIAVGSGVGLRFDFQFLIVRLDVATKVWDPGEKPSRRFVANKFNATNMFNDPNQTLWNIAIGYPF
ncbi:MAG: BamA/TamA family outer membrane protein [Bacteroidota bacterium]|nr:BamA/TamA family outer membrane protein [Bacteroidota bacterium]